MEGSEILLKTIGFLMTRSHHFALPAGPPPEVQDEIDAAWERAQALVDGALAVACGEPVALPV